MRTVRERPPLSLTDTLPARSASCLFAAYIACVPVMQPSWLVDGHAVLIADVILIAVLAAVMIAIRSELRWWRLRAWHGALAAYMAACTAAALLSPDVKSSVIKLAGVGSLAAAAFLASQFARHPPTARLLTRAWLAGALVTIIASLLGVVLFYSGAKENIFLYSYGSLIPGPYPRAMGAFLNANMMCSFMIASAIIGISALRTPRLPSWAGAAFAAIASAVAMLSLSPGLGGLGLAAALRAKHLPTAGPRRLTKFAGWALAIGALLAATISPTTFLRDRPLLESLSHLEPSSRLQTWRGALDTIGEHPWFGAGPGQPVARVEYLSASGGHEELTDAHNMFLSVPAENGLPAFAAFIVMLLLVLRRDDNDRSRQAAPGMVAPATLRLALICGVLYPSITGSFEDSRHTWLLLGLLAGSIDAQRD